MADYEALYRQGLVQIQKQKDQIRKLQDQIRERCQSYLIHSSRYRSKNGSDQKMSLSARSGTDGSQVDGDSRYQAEEKENSCALVSNIVDVVVDVKGSREKGVDQGTWTDQANQIEKRGTINSQRPGVQQQRTSLQRKETEKLQTSQQSGQQGQVERKETVNSQQSGQEASLQNKQTITSQNSLQNVGSVQSRDSYRSSAHDPLIEPRQNVLQSQSTHPQVYWQQVIAGLKQRMGTLQRQKSDQAQRILTLQQQIKTYQKQQKSITDLNASMKKKPTKSIEYSSSITQQQRQSPVPLNSVVQDKLSKLFSTAQVYMDMSKANNAEQKIEMLNSYIAELHQRLRAYEEREPNGDLKESKVQEYSFSTPYRKIKTGGSNVGSEGRDYYEESQLEMLKKKCKELEMQLTLSRNKDQSSPTKQDKVQNSRIPLQNVQNQQQQIKDPPYLIEQQLEKPNSPFVKRSFVRKKVVKRNLSAMILRSPSRSKEESKASMINQLQKLKQRLQKSKDGSNDKEVMSLSRKVDKLEGQISQKQDKIDEISEDESSIARSSGVQDNFTEIIQVETSGPGFKNYTAHILGLSKRDNKKK